MTPDLIADAIARAKLQPYSLRCLLREIEKVLAEVDKGFDREKFRERATK